MRPILIAILAVLVLPAAAQASTLKVVSGVLTYTDTAVTNANAVTFGLSPDGTRVTVTEAGKTSRNRAISITSDGSCTVAAGTGSCALAGLTSISVDTGGANDTVSQGVALPSKLAGGAGNDSLTGGAGDDSFPDDAGADTLVGGGGHDTADYSALKAPIAVVLDGQPGDGAQGENDNVGADIEVVIGGEANDVITGSPADNQLVGGPGDDTLSGGAGNDVLDGGTGNDALSGGDGSDTATYANSAAGVHVTLDGQPGDGSAGENDNVDTENVVGSPGDDVLVGNDGPNVLGGGTGNDRLLGRKGADLLDGGSGDDIIEALDAEKDAIACGDGEDGTVSDRMDIRTDCDYIKYRTVAATATALHVSSGYVRAPVRCSPAVAERCSGRLALKAGRLTLGSLRFRLAPGRRWVAKVKLTRKGRSLVRHHRVTIARLTVHDSSAIPTTQTIRIAR